MLIAPGHVDDCMAGSQLVDDIGLYQMICANNVLVVCVGISIEACIRTARVVVDKKSFRLISNQGVFNVE